MLKIIKNESQKEVQNFQWRELFAKFWKKCGLIVGYVVACTMVILDLTLWSFDYPIFIFSFVFSLSYLLRLGRAYVPIKRFTVVLMWSIFCFGLLGIVMNLLHFGDIYIVGAYITGAIAVYLYSSIPEISYFLGYNDIREGLDYRGETRCNGAIISSIISIVFSVFLLMIDFNTMETKRDALLQEKFKKQAFVPVKFIGQESYKGTTYYVLEAKGEQFYVYPSDVPSVRGINANSQVRVIFGMYSEEYNLKSVELIEFKH